MLFEDAIAQWLEHRVYEREFMSLTLFYVAPAHLALEMRFDVTISDFDFHLGNIGGMESGGCFARATSGLLYIKKSTSLNLYP